MKVNTRTSGRKILDYPKTIVRKGTGNLKVIVRDSNKGVQITLVYIPETLTKLIILLFRLHCEKTKTWISNSQVL